MELNHKPNMAYGDYKVGEEMWSSIEPFNYDLPNGVDILSLQWRSVLSLFGWLFGLFIVSMLFAPKISRL